VEVLKAGAAYYVRKPFRLTQLERLIRKCLSWFEPDADPEVAYPYLETEDLEFSIPSDLSVVTPVVQFLWRRSRLALGDAWSVPFRCGLEEILTNAVEHGNLGMSFEEKSGALLGDSYWDAIGERRERPEFRDRVVHLGYHRDAELVRCRVTDEGAGFEWREWCRNGNLDRLPGASGRGIFLARIHSSGLEYNEAGNTATVTWNLARTDRETR